MNVVFSSKVVSCIRGGGVRQRLFCVITKVENCLRIFFPLKHDIFCDKMLSEQGRNITNCSTFLFSMNYRWCALFSRCKIEVYNEGRRALDVICTPEDFAKSYTQVYNEFCNKMAKFIVHLGV